MGIGRYIVTHAQDPSEATTPPKKKLSQHGIKPMSKHFRIKVTTVTTYCVEVGVSERLTDAIDAVRGHWKHGIDDDDIVEGVIVPEQSVEQCKAEVDEVITND